MAKGRFQVPFSGHVDFPKSPSSDFIWRGTKDFSYLIGANFTDPKTGRYA